MIRIRLDINVVIYYHWVDTPFWWIISFRGYHPLRSVVSADKVYHMFGIESL